MEDLALVATVPVAKDKALFKTGKKKGKLRPGCRFKGKKTFCTPEVAAKLNRKTPAKANTKSKKRGGGVPMMITAKTPEGAERQRVFQALLESRKSFKIARETGDCERMRWAGRKIVGSLKYMAALPAKKSKKNPNADPRIRNRRYLKEIDRVVQQTMVCGGLEPSTVVRGGKRQVDPRKLAQRYARYVQYMKSRNQKPTPESEWEAVARLAYEQSEEAMMNRFSGLSKRKAR
jgi:hypothetical protein